MAKGFIIESMIAATDVVAYNRYAKSAVDIDGGNLVALTAPTAQGDDVWTATKPATGGLNGLWIAYNPSFRITEIGDNEYAGLSADVRDYTNVAGRVFTVFKPQIGDIFVLSADAVDASAENVAAGDYLEAKNAQTTWTRKTSSPDANTTAAVVMHKVNIPFPAVKGHVGFTKQAGFKVELVQQ